MFVQPMCVINDNPKIIEVHWYDYRRSGIMCPLLTISLQIPPDKPILGEPTSGKILVQNTVEYYFRSCHNPAVSGDVFLPDRFTPLAAVQAYDNLLSGHNSGLEIEHYISAHHEVLLIECESVYINYRGNSWFARYWSLDPGNSFGFL
ncbi:MAG: hypothetical protein LUD18_07250 [Lachnospiraceae bacterium]|nr:hypothetical protein [Lachnospiraceae bacterium]